MAFNRNSGGRGGDRGGFRPRPSFSAKGGPASGWGGRPSFGGRGGGDRSPIEMHDAICDNCGKSCQVPFRPTSGKPIFCSECFEGKRERRPEPRFENRAPTAPQNNRQLDEINSKLDKILGLLEKPAKKKTVTRPASGGKEPKVEKEVVTEAPTQEIS